MMYDRNRSGYDPIIMEYTAKYTPAVVTLDLNANISRSQGNRQSTDINDDDTVEGGSNTKILRTQVTQLLKVPASNNARNATRNLLKYLLVKIQQSNRHVTFLPWYPSNSNSSAVPIKQPYDISKGFQALQKYYHILKPKQHTK